MKKCDYPSHFHKIIQIVFISLTVIISFCAGKSEAVGWKAGVASVSITPEKPVWMAGYSSRDKLSEGKIHDLYVKALALEDPEGNRFVIVTADLVSVTFDFSNRVASEIHKQFGIPRKAVLFNISHTHSGPEVRITNRPFYIVEERLKQIRPYVDWVEKKYIAVISDAVKTMKPAELSFSSKNPVPFAVSRRFPTPEGIVYRSGPSSYYTGGSRDDIVPVLRITDSDGAVKAILFGYACHPITLKGYKLCGDYPGFAQQYIEEVYPDVTAMFMQGCCGELVPNARYQVEYAMGHGKALAEAVIQALSGEQIPINGKLRFDYDEITLDLQPPPKRTVLEDDLKSDNFSVRRKAEFMLKKMDNNEPIQTTLRCPLQVLRIGKELIIVGLCGEPVVDYAVNIKSENLTQFTWVAGCCNYAFGYLPTGKVIREGGYEGGGSMLNFPFSGPFTETVEQKVMDEVRRLVNNVFKD